LEGTSQQPKKIAPKSLAVLIIILILASGLAGFFVGYWSLSSSIKELQSQLLDLQEQMSKLQEKPPKIIYENNTVYQNSTFYQNNTIYVPYILGENVSLVELYEKVRDSVVVVHGIEVSYDIFGRPYYSRVQGSGFVYNYNLRMVVVTNYHVVADAINITVTFANGNGYPARVLGRDPYADLALLSVDAPESEFKPLEIVSSSTLRVGDIVVAVGNPYGLAGSMSLGIVSALGRTLSVDLAGGYPIANLIQTTAPLNPGNSGGPLLNLKGQVVGVTTAIVSDSQGIGFAIPSNTVLREIADLVEFGSYNRHPWLGAMGVDMSYEIARVMGVNVTYGWLITNVVSGGPAANAGLRGGTRQVVIAGQFMMVGGDIIIAINGTRITGIDSLSAYLEENTSPGQTIIVTVVRQNQIISVAVALGTRPLLHSST